MTYGMMQCEQCGKEYAPNKRRTNKFCSDRCRQKAYRARSGQSLTPIEKSLDTPSARARKAAQTKASQYFTMKCKHCGGEYGASGTQAPNSMYCSAACKTAAYRARYESRAAHVLSGALGESEFRARYKELRALGETFIVARVYSDTRYEVFYVDARGEFGGHTLTLPELAKWIESSRDTWLIQARESVDTK